MRLLQNTKDKCMMMKILKGCQVHMLIYGANEYDSINTSSPPQSVSAMMCTQGRAQLFVRRYEPGLPWFAQRSSRYF